MGVEAVILVSMGFLIYQREGVSKVPTEGNGKETYIFTQAARSQVITAPQEVGSILLKQKRKAWNIYNFIFFTKAAWLPM